MNTGVDAPKQSAPKTGILFVCMGNICRSPLAAGVFQHLARARGLDGRFDVDSCGMGNWHVGETADARSLLVARRRGIVLTGRARMVAPREDFARFALIVPMDRSNKRGLLELGAPRDRVRLMRSFDPAMTGAPEDALDVPDPYSGGEEGFETVIGMLLASCEGLLDEQIRANR